MGTYITPKRDFRGVAWKLVRIVDAIFAETIRSLFLRELLATSAAPLRKRAAEAA
jgi:hypothetical protein